MGEIVTLQLGGSGSLAHFSRHKTSAKTLDYMQAFKLESNFGICSIWSMVFLLQAV